MTTTQRSDNGTSNLPRISLLIPCRNEEEYIEGCLDSLIDDFVAQHAEVIVIDGDSDDRTTEVIEAYRRRYPFVRLLHNPERLQSHAMNVGLAAARGATIVRADAHSTYPPSYVRTCAELLERVPAANVGGVMAPEGGSTFERVVADAMSSRLGIGWSRFHLGDFSGYTDTVYLGTFRRSIFDRVGYYDPDSHPAEDAELNCRILAQHEKIYLDSSIRVRYQPRGSFRSLARQFFWYGRARCYIVQKHRKLFTAGRLLPPLLVVSMAAALAFAIVYPPTVLLPLAYGCSIGAVAVHRYRNVTHGRLRRALLLTGVLATMHLSYGSGFILRLLHLIR